MFRALCFASSLFLLQACAQAGDDPADPGDDGPDAGMVAGDPEDCGDGVDNDGDGKVDCFDGDCAGDSACLESACDDGLDNDADQMIDCFDPDCDGVGTCEHDRELSCADDLDNDGNGVTDCQDVACDGIGECEYAKELTCDDGLDNDGDGKVDCTDTSCNGVGTCETSERSCGDGVDNDEDGDFDCDDADCAGAGPCLVASCPPGSLLLTATAAGMPLTIPDASSTDSVISVTEAGLVTRVSVGLSVTHTYPSDLDFTIVGPNGVSALLAADHGSADDAYSDTLFADEALTSIAGASEPFTGAFQPEQPLASLTGSSSNGDWTLQVVDDASIDTGTLDSYAVYLCYCAAPCEPEVDCTDGVDNDGDTATDCEDPGCDGVATCEYAHELTCGDGEDNDADGLTDCDDPDCGDETSCVLPCPAGSAPYTFAATDTPLAIPDSGSVTSSVSVTEAGTIAAVGIGFSATHTFDGDLDIFVASPTGTAVELSTDNGSLDDDYTGTLFVDGASTPITSGSAPFTGPYSPEQPLSALDGEVANGTWVLTVTDDAASDTGTVTDFRVLVCITP